ncbi:MAG: amino acid adenylation domain-containing protein, partial [Acidobacteriota bacterium]|nr:amino acid adenylation domain-containing protein [Acidobacteriota bacterium]
MRAISTPISRIERGDRLPLSFAQQRVWFLAQMEGGSEAYHVPIGFRLSGNLHRNALRQALNNIVVRHESLRTTFNYTDGEPVQRISVAEASQFHLQEHDLRQHRDARHELDRLSAEEARASFDLEAGPLIRGRLIREAEHEHVLLITVHHIVFDGWSTGVFVKELSALYGAFVRDEADSLPEMSLQYVDYAVWQRKWIEGDILGRQSEYWKTTLAGAPRLLELPTDHARPMRQDYAGAFAGIVLNEDLVVALKSLSKRHGTTLHMTLLAGWAALLGRLSGQNDVVIGTPVANRGRLEIEGLIGFFVNTLALRLDLAGGPTVGELLTRVKTQALIGQQHQDIPFEQVVEVVRPVRSLQHNPLFQVMFNWQSVMRDELELPGVKFKVLPSAPYVMAKVDLVLSLRESGGTIVGGLGFATSLFERPTVERYLEYLRTLLRAMAADDKQMLDHVPMLSSAERDRVVYEWNATVEERPANKCVHQLFEEQVAIAPEAVAVVFEDASLSYGELNRRANRLAHYLRDLGVKPDARVAICLERSFEMVIGLLAVLKAGGAYLPLDPAHPKERLQFMLTDSAAMVIITQIKLREKLEEISGDAMIVVLNSADGGAGSDELAERNLEIEAVNLTSHHLAYVIYTSGSTGAPKGVMVEHDHIVNLLSSTRGSYKLDFRDVVLQETQFIFDAAVGEFFRALVTGARLVMPRPGGHKEPAYLIDLIRRNDITVVGFAPGMLRAFLDHVYASKCLTLAYVMSGGEDLSMMDVRWFRERLPNALLENQYGPTETTVYATQYVCHADESRKPAIGRPIGNTRIYVLDNQEQPVPVGVVGEIYVAGAGVTRGYLNQPELTAESFRRDPFSKELTARMYRTGDLGRWRG